MSAEAIIQSPPGDDNGIPPVILPDIFDCVDDYVVRCCIRAELSRLKEHRNVDRFCKALEDTFRPRIEIHHLPPFGVSADEIRSFAVDFVAALPPLPPEPEQEAEQVQQYQSLITEAKPTPKIVRCPPPSWLESMNLADYCFVPMHAYQSDGIRKALRNYCFNGNKEFALDGVKKLLRPACKREFAGWLDAIDAHREQHREKIRNEISRIKEQFKKDAEQLAADYSGAELANKLKALKIEVQKLIEEEEND